MPDHPHHRLSDQLHAVLTALPDEWVTVESVARTLEAAGHHVDRTFGEPRFRGYLLQSSLRELRRAGCARSLRGHPVQWHRTPAGTRRAA